MKSRLPLGVFLVVCVCLTSWTDAAQSAAALDAVAASSAVPSLINYTGILKDAGGRTLTSLTGVTFLLYKDEQGGAPLWLETQNVTPDKTSHYTVQLGATSARGLSSDLFVTGQGRWLAVQIANEAEQPRVLLVAVPYAMKAVDAETVGGLPASAFVLAAAPSNGAPATASGVATPASVTPLVSSNVTTTGGTVGALPLWTKATNVQSSVVTQTGSGTTAKIGIGTTTPATTLDVKGNATVRGTLALSAIAAATVTKGSNSQAERLVASAFSSSTSTAVNQTFQWQAEPAANNTAKPTSTLNLLFGLGATVPSETGLKLSSKGVFTFATGQTFPGTGTITGVTAGTDLTGGGTSGNVTVNLDTTEVPQLSTANTFTGNQTVNGNVSATQLVSTAAQFTPPLQVTSTTQVANLNASLLGGFSASAFAMLGSSLFPINNNFTGNQTVSGVLTSTTVSGANAATFVKGSSSTPTSAAAIQVENLTTLGETAFLENGNAGNPFPVLKLLQVTGATGAFITCQRPDGTEKCNIDNAGTFHSGSDFAEALPIRGNRQLYEPGDVLVMANSGTGVEKTSEHYSRRVVGIFSTRPGFLGADKDGDTRVDKNDVPVAITGIVPAKVSAENGPVRVGDLLVTASTPGYAMKATDHKRMVGAIVGKALEPLRQGVGVIRVLVTMQ